MVFQKCTVEELVILKHIVEDPCVKQNDLAKMTGKSLSTVKRIMDVMQEKGYVRRVNGKRYGKWKVLVDVSECN
ncbi:MAG: winged helix-turn-helix domain-containing protein [Lachnospiraceae bacterium]|nr:winged helix-turn-helix domain-containing protein [Lachnospiraceae bacterium]